MPALRLSNLSKSFPGGVVAVHDLSMEIASGERVAVVGPSGCGKSTLLRLIAGLETPDSGRIEIDGRDVTQLDPSRREIALVFQDHALYPHMTVRGNLAFPLNARARHQGWVAGMHSWTSPRRRADAQTEAAAILDRVQSVAALLDIESLLDRRPDSLSGGERQRVALGRAIIRQPKLFLLDEPLASIDARLRLELRLEFKRLQRRLATAAIFVTHDQEEAMSIGDRLLVMSAGRVQQFAPPGEIYRCPANRFVANFFGSLPMNFLDGHVEAVADERCFICGDTRIPMLPSSGHPAGAPPMQAVTLGVRSEHIECTRPDAGHIQGSIESVEEYGDHRRIEVRLHAERNPTWLVRTHMEMGELTGQGSIGLRLIPRHIHLFAPGPFGAAVR